MRTFGRGFGWAVLAIAGCQGQPAGGGAGSAAAPGSNAPRMGSAPAASVPGPEAAAEDLDVPATQTALKCAKNPKGGACILLAAFSGCAVWNPVVPSGDGRWLGRGHRVADGKVTE